MHECLLQTENLAAQPMKWCKTSQAIGLSSDIRYTKSSNLLPTNFCLVGKS